MTKDKVVRKYSDGHPVKEFIDTCVKCYGEGGTFTDGGAYGDESPYGTGATKAEIEFAAYQLIDSVLPHRVETTGDMWLDDSDRQWIGEYLILQKEFPDGKFKYFFVDGPATGEAVH